MNEFYNRLKVPCSQLFSRKNRHKCQHSHNVRSIFGLQYYHVVITLLIYYKIYLLNYACMFQYLLHSSGLTPTVMLSTKYPK